MSQKTCYGSASPNAALAVEEVVMRKRSYSLVALSALVLASVPALAGEPVVTVSAVKVAMKITPFGQDKGKPYPSVTFDTTVNKAVQRGSYMAAKVSCLVGTKKMTDSVMGVMSPLEKVEAGETATIEIATFIRKPLEEAPSSCDISIRLAAIMDSQGKEVAKYCYTPQGLTEGACPKAK